MKWPLIVLLVLCVIRAEAAISVTRDLPNADIVMDFTGGSPGDLITVANLTAGTHNASGITGAWSLSRTMEHTYTVTSSAIPLLSRIIASGATYSATSGRAINFDLDQAVANGSTPLQETETYTFGANTAENVTVASMSTFNATLNTEADFLQLYSPFSITQFHNNSGVAYLNAHGSLFSVSTTGYRIPIGAGPYWISQRHKATGVGEVIVQDGVTGAFIGCSRCQGDAANLSALVIGDYISPQGGSFKHSLIALAFDSRATLPLAPGAFTLPPPTGITAYDDASDISLNLGPDLDTVGNAAFAYKIERSTDSGASWSVLESALDVPFPGAGYISPYVDSTVTGSVTYKYRVTSIVNEWMSTPAVSNSVTHGGGAWTDALNPATADSDDSQNGSRLRNLPVTLPSGTASKIRVYVKTVVFNTFFKAALYNNAGTLLASAGETSVAAGTSNSWLEFLIPLTSVTSGTYRISWTAQANGSDVVYRYKNGTGQTHVVTDNYSAFPLNPVGSTAFDINGADAVGVFVQQP